MIDINKRLVETYFAMISNLGFDSKLDLISKLTSSMRKKSHSSDTSVIKLFGAFENDKSAEEIISELRASRVFNKNLESFE